MDASAADVACKLSDTTRKKPMKKTSESSWSYLAGWSKQRRGLIPSFVTQFWGNGDNWTPLKGVWYAAEKAGVVGGGWGGAGGSAWEDRGIPVLPGDKFRLVSYGTLASPSIWEVEFTSPLR